MIDRFLTTELDLEVETLFLEILHDPRARLFRAQRAPEARRWILPTEPVGIHAPSLTKAERKLLGSYREEVAYLLRCAYYEEFFATSPIRTRYARAPGDPCGQVSAKETIRARLTRAVHDARIAFPLDLSTQELRSAELALAEAGSDPVQLIHAAARLVPHHANTSYLAGEAIVAGRRRLSDQLYIQCRDDATNPLLAAVASGALANNHFYLHKYQQAALEYRRSLRFSQELACTYLNLLFCSMQSGDRRGAVDTAARIVERWNPRSPELLEWSQTGVGPQVKSSMIPLTQDCLRITKSLESRFGPDLEPVFEALTPAGFL